VWRGAGRTAQGSDLSSVLTPTANWSRTLPRWQAALRLGDWKLLSYCYSVKGKAGETSTGPVVPQGGLPKDWDGGDSPVVLFNLAKDPSEKSNVANENPEVVARILSRLKVLAEQMVEPMQWTPPYQAKCGETLRKPPPAT
jgi:hypothetical protein